MAESNTNKERMKLALIPVLGLVLFFVLPESESSDTATAPAEPAPAEGGTESAVPSMAIAPFESAPWPETPVNTILAHNPFELRDPRAEMDQAFADAGITVTNEWTLISQTEFLQLDQPTGRDVTLSVDETSIEKQAGPTEFERELTRRRQRLSELQKQPVSMILRTDQGRAAVIDGRSYREGEEVEEGIRVVSIGLNGVILEAVAPGK